MTSPKELVCDLCQEVMEGLVYCPQTNSFYCVECHSDCSPECIEETNKRRSEGA